jgi:3-oxoadipate enol-lactonase
VTAVEVHAVVEGPPDGPALVLSPSLGSTLDMWEPQAAALRGRFRVVRYDHRGHGRSPVPPGPYQIDDLATDVLGLLDRLDLPAAHFCGISLGAMTGIVLAATHPRRVRRLVLCCTAARMPTPEAYGQRAAAVRREGTAAIAESVVSRWVTPGFAADHPELIARLQAMVADTPDEGYAACCQALERMDLRGLLPRIGAPTLLIAGADDPATPPDQARLIAASIPDAQVRVLSPAAHLASIEQPDAVTRLLASHLTTTEAARE